jgi:hypothetical protein
VKTIIKISVLVIVLTASIYAIELNSDSQAVVSNPILSDCLTMLLARPQLSFAYETDHFLIHYEKSGENAVFHPGEDSLPSDGIPDYVNRISDYLEMAYAVYSEHLGLDQPPPDNGAGGDDKYDIYVTDVIGRTTPDLPTNYYPGRAAYTAYTFIGHDLRTLIYPDDPLPFLKATCAHELFHAFQLSYRGYPDDGNYYWWYELSANWAEEQVFDDLNDIYYYLPDYYRKVDRSLYLTGGSHMYGAWVFAEYLSENYGNEIINRIFNHLITFDKSIYAIEAALTEYNEDVNSCYGDFARCNYFTANRWREGFFEEGEYFPETVPVSMTHQIYPTGIITTPRGVENLGCVYLTFNKPELPKANLNILFNADAYHPLSISITAVYTNRPMLRTISKVERNGQIHIRVEDFAHTEEVILAVYWPYEGITAIDSACYSYSADIDTISSAISEDRQTLPSRFEFESIYPNPFNSSCLIAFKWNQQPAQYSMKIFDIGGRLIDNQNGYAQTGANKIFWKPSAAISGGVYFCNLSINGSQVTQKLLYLR